jgi:hypothetical protein
VARGVGVGVSVGVGVAPAVGTRVDAGVGAGLGVGANLGAGVAGEAGIAVEVGVGVRLLTVLRNAAPAASESRLGWEHPAAIATSRTLNTTRRHALISLIPSSQPGSRFKG